jgi:hypothetical protein
LGIGLIFQLTPEFSLNAGIGAVQNLYSLKTGLTETELPDGSSEKTPIMVQSWGKPLAQMALGGTFTFKKNFTLDAMLSSNGTSLDNTSFMLLFSAHF